MKRIYLLAILLAAGLFYFTCVRDAPAQLPTYSPTTSFALEIAQRAWGPCDGPIQIHRYNESEVGVVGHQARHAAQPDAQSRLGQPT